jgi:hypothetical protein
MIQIALVALPAAWLAALLAHLGWPLVQGLAVNVWQLWPEVLGYQPVLLWAGPAVALLGCILLAMQVLQHKTSWLWVLDDALAALGVVAFGLACAYTPTGSWWQLAVVPVAAILMLLTTREDDIGTTLIRWALFTAAVAGLHTWVVGW